MSELLRRAGEQHRAQQARAASDAEITARQEALHQQHLQESERRKQEFIGFMRANDVPTKPFFVAHYHVKRTGLPPATYTHLGTPKVGEGWLVRQYTYSYEEGITDGIFVVEDGTVYRCAEQLDDNSKTSWPSLATGREYFVGSDWWREGDDANVLYTHPESETLFAGDKGLDILAGGLVLNGVLEETQ